MTTSHPHVGRFEKLLWAAASRGDLDQVVYALDQGADIDWHNPFKQDRTPLHVAAWNDHESIVGLLVDRGADIDAADVDRRRPLHVAAWNGHESVVGLLVDRGADVDAADAYRDTPLHMAAREGHDSVARLLLDRGASINASDTINWTPLYMAAKADHEAVVRLLLDRGADTTIESVRRPSLRSPLSPPNPLISSLRETG